MKALIITNTFPPTSGSHVQRMMKMANSLVYAGIDVSVLTYLIDENHPQYDESFIESVDSRINVIRAPMGYLHRKAYSTFKDESDAHYNKEVKKKNQLKSWIYATVTRFKDVLLFPDTLIDWYYSVIKYEKEQHVIKTLNPDVIISCSQPNSVHLIGYRLSKMYNIPQYMDYADPWVYLGEYKEIEKTLRFRRGRRKEEQIIKNAIGYSFSAPGCRDLYIDKYGISPDRTVVAMSGFEERLIERSNSFNERVISGSIITFTYGGALHEYVRDPKPFFSAAKEFEKAIDVNIRTDNIGQAENWLLDSGNANCIHILPYLTFDEYFEEMLSKDIILFFGNKNDVQLPGKIFNCVATGKYIFYIKSNDVENDTVEQILSAYGRGFIARNDPEDIRRVIRSILDSKDAIRNKVDLSSESIMQFSDKEQYANLAKHLKKLLEEKQND